MDITFEVETTDVGTLIPAIIGADRTESTEVVIADNIRLRYLETETKRASSLPDLVIFALNIPAGIAINVIADRISQHLRQRTQKCHIKKAVIRTIGKRHADCRRVNSPSEEIPVDLSTI